LPSMSNEIAQPTEQDLRRSASVEGGKGNKPPALDTSSCTLSAPFMSSVECLVPLDAPGIKAQMQRRQELICAAVTSTPHPPSSSTQTTSTAQNTASTDGSETPVLSGSQNEKDYLRVAEEAPEVPKKNRGLLHVPSRSSSHKIQPSPTSTGLSGATASDPRESIGGRSKESKSSILGRRRNGSATSSKMSITQQEPSTGTTGSANPASSGAKPSQQPKKKGFLSFLCCGAPDDSANNLGPNDAALPVKITKVPSGRPTTASRPEHGSTSQVNAVAESQNEKEPLKKTEPEREKTEPASLESGRTLQSGGPAVNGDANRVSGDARDQPLPALPTEAEKASPPVGQPNPSVVVQGPTRAASTRASSSVQAPAPAPAPTPEPKDAEGDVKMVDSGPVPTEKVDLPPAPVPRQAETARTVLPPPPSSPPPVQNDEVAAPEPTEQKQQWLLPPIAPRFQGKKCLVLDLDETLVHSSFKVCFTVNDRIQITNSSRFYTKQISLFLLKSKANITMCT
jgi:RNA polymerase II subunit A small phosphatase-like protein